MNEPDIQIHTVSLGVSQAYLIRGEVGLILVDAGLPRQEKLILRHLRSLGDPLRLIFVTHAHLDHYGSAAALRRLTGAPIAIHREDAASLARAETPIRSARGRGRLTKALLPLVEVCLRPAPTEPDFLLDDGTSLRPYGLDATVVHTPGHTPGSSCLVVGGRVGFVGDLLSTVGRPHLQGNYATSWLQLDRSLVRLRTLELERAYPGHGLRPLSRERLDRLLARRAQRTDHQDDKEG